jgi:hypothetical protein
LRQANKLFTINKKSPSYVKPINSLWSKKFLPPPLKFLPLKISSDLATKKGRSGFVQLHSLETTSLSSKRCWQCFCYIQHKFPFAHHCRALTKILFFSGAYKIWTFPQIFSPLESWTVGSTKLFPNSRVQLAQIPQRSKQKKNTLQMAKSMYIYIKRKGIADCPKNWFREKVLKSTTEQQQKLHVSERLHLQSPMSKKYANGF